MRKHTLQRLLFGLILTLFLGLCSWWVVTFPYRPEQLYRAVPPNAVYISEHEALAGRWQQAARNPLTRALLDAFAVDREALELALDDPGIQRVLEKLAARKTVVAYVPALGPEARPAWMVATWAGSYAQLMRWRVFANAMSDFERVRFDNGRYGWQLPVSHMIGSDGRTSSRDHRAPSDTLSVAAIEGIVLGCVSDDPMAVQYLVRRIEKGYPPPAALDRQKAHSAISQDHAGPASRAVPDRGWIRWNGGDPLDFGLTAYDEHTAAGWLRGWSLAPAGSVPGDAGELDALHAMLGNAPDALMLTSWDHLQPWVEQPDHDVGLRIAGRALDSMAVDASPVFISLLSGDLSGRILKLRVPTLTAGLRVKDEATALDLVTQTLDSMNVRYGMALIARPVPLFVPEIDGRAPGTDTQTRHADLMVIDTTQLGIYNALGAQEKPAFGTCKGWLLFSTNVSALRTIIQRAVRGRPRTGASKVEELDWRKELAARNAEVYAVADLERTCSSIQDAIAVYSLALMFKQSARGERTREQLDKVQAWLGALAPFEKGTMWLQAENDRVRLNVRLGPSQKRLNP